MNKKEILAYNFDASQKEGKLNKVYLPQTIEEVKKIVKKEKNLTLRGGGTGLVGGSVPQGDSILDLSKLNKILELNKEKKTILVEVGVILDELQKYLDKYSLEFPLNPSSHSICTIGGMIATNAVGTRAIKYGKTGDWVRWIEVVNFKGELIRIPKTDLKDYVGMEGITGVIVRACLQLIEGKKRYVEIFYFDKYEDIIQKVKELKQRSNISAIEFFDKKISNFLGLGKVYSLIVEFEEEAKDKEKLKKSEEIYYVRDSLFPKLASEGYYLIEDPKIMLEKSLFLVEWLEKKEIPFYAHISVGIFHPCFSKEKEHLISDMMSLVKKNFGQITGEHGIGLLKKSFLDPNDKKLFESIKKRLDPLNKFNKNKIV